MKGCAVGDLKVVPSSYEVDGLEGVEMCAPARVRHRPDRRAGAGSAKGYGGHDGRGGGAPAGITPIIRFIWAKCNTIRHTRSRALGLRWGMAWGCRARRARRRGDAEAADSSVPRTVDRRTVTR
jgi:hypothetical protein